VLARVFQVPRQPPSRPCPTYCPILDDDVRKTSVYLEDEQAARLARLARQEGRSQAEILREAVDSYQPPASRDRDFALAAGFPRVDGDQRAISQIPEEELLEGFGS
jgi:predicted DNA-binding protein